MPIKNEKHEVVLFLATHKDISPKVTSSEDKKEESENDESGDERYENDDNESCLPANQYHRRRSRAVLYQLSGHYKRSENSNMKTKLNINNVSDTKYRNEIKRYIDGRNGDNGTDAFRIFFASLFPSFSAATPTYRQQILYIKSIKAFD